MTTDDEKAIRGLIDTRCVWLNGDACRAWLLVMLNHVGELNKMVLAQAERIAAQSELLTNKAEVGNGGVTESTEALDGAWPAW